MEYITIKKPSVILLQETGIGTSEIAARCCYSSFDQSENACVREISDGYNDIDSSELLEKLAWVHHHHSVLEHASLTYYVQGISRGVLQEHARHRIQSISVKSTRYTMSSVLNAYVASLENVRPLPLFRKLVKGLDMFVLEDDALIDIEIDGMFNKISTTMRILGLDTCDIIAKSSLDAIKEHSGYGRLVFEALENGKTKRNAGDRFKHIVTDSWKTDMVITFNIRSLKNYFELRDSGAAWYQIRALAEEIKNVTPSKYLDLIIKNNRTLNDKS